MTTADQNGPGCTLCARPGDFGPITPDDPHSGICPWCSAMSRPVRAALEQAVVTVARQNLTDAETLPLRTATADELTFHLTALRRSLRSVLQLVGEPLSMARPEALETVLHTCGHCRATTENPVVVSATATGGDGPLWFLAVCPSCAQLLRQGGQ